MTSPLNGLRNEAWKTTTLGELTSEVGCFIQTGPFGSQLHKSDYEEDGIGVVNPTHLAGDTIAHDDVPRISAMTASRLERHRLTAGDILFARRGEIGRHGLVTTAEDGWLCGTGCFLVRVRRSDVDNQFLSYFISTPATGSWLKQHAAGVVMPNLNNTVLHSLPITLAPIDEQRKIAGVLRLVRRALEQQERLIALTTELKKGLQNQLFSQGLRHEAQKQTEINPVPESWEVLPLRNCAVVQTGVAKGRKLDGKETVTLPYLRVANVQSGFLDLTEMKAITILAKEKPRFMLQDGDVVLTEGGDFDKLGRGFIWRGEIEDCVHQNHIFAVRVDRTRLLPAFFAHLSQSPYGKAYFLSVAHKTTNLACINTTKLKAFPVMVPPLNEQCEIVATLEAVDSKLERHQRKRVLLTDLFRTLLHQLMTAQLRVHNLDLFELEGN